MSAGNFLEVRKQNFGGGVPVQLPTHLCRQPPWNLKTRVKITSLLNLAASHTQRLLPDHLCPPPHATILCLEQPPYRASSVTAGTGGNPMFLVAFLFGGGAHFNKTMTSTKRTKTTTQQQWQWRQQPCLLMQQPTSWSDAFIRGCHMVDLEHKSCFFQLNFLFSCIFQLNESLFFWFLNFNCCRSYLCCHFSNSILG